MTRGNQPGDRPADGHEERRLHAVEAQRNLLPPAPGQMVAGVFRIESLLGVGAGGSVYRVVEVDSGRVRALKVFARTANVEQTLHEFRILARLEHPGCVKVHAFGHDRQFGAYLVMDLVEGSAPTEVLPRGESPELRSFTQRILETLGYLHGRGIVHGDLKPSNVRCVDGDPARPVLLDFGLASTRDQDLAGGTILYMAPELFRRQPRDSRSDLYALGIMLYEIAAGAPPYDGATDMQITRGHLSGSARALAQSHRKVSDAYSRLVRWLMAREPGERPTSAYEALPALAELTGEELVMPSVKLDPAICVSTPVLAQRDGVLAAFDQLLTRASADRRGGILVAFGAPGSGRTRLIEELAVRARLAGARIVRWDPSLTGASTAVDESLRAMLSDQTSEDVSGLVESLRRLQRLETAPPEDGDRTGNLDRVADVALDVLHTASRRAPVVMLIDNAGRGGPHAPAFITQLARGVGQSKIVLVTACETPEHFGTSELDPSNVRLEELDPLEPSATSAVLRTAIGRIENLEELAGWVCDSAAGNPSATMELIYWLVESGMLARRKGSWYTTDTLERAQVGAGGAGESIARRRLERIVDRPRAILRAAAVMGLSFDPTLAAEAAGVVPPSDEELEPLLRNRLLIPCNRSRWRLRFARPALQRVLVQELDDADRYRIHGALARHLLGSQKDRTPEGLATAGLLHDIAWHLLGAREWQAGLPLACAAADHARAHLKLGEAESLYRHALTAMDGLPKTRQPRALVLRNLGDVQMEADRATDAVRLYEESAALIDKGDPIDVWRRFGHALVVIGRYTEATRVLGRVVANPNVPYTSRVQAAHDIGWVYMLTSDWEQALSAADGAGRLARRHGDDRLDARVRKLRGNILWQQGQYDKSLVENEAALRVYESISDTRGAAESFMAMGTAHRHLAQYADAVRCYEQSLARFEELGYRRGVGKCQNNLGIVHYYQGDWPAATRRFEAFLRILERTGERVERVSLLNNLGSLYRERGMFDRAEQLLTEGLDLSRALGTTRIEAMLLGNLGEALLRAGRYGAARRCLDEAIAVSQRIEAHDEIVEAERRGLELQSLENPRALSSDRIREVLEAAEAASMKLEVANLNRLLAIDHRLRGRLTAAAACLDHGEQALRGAGAALEEARLRRERGLLLGAQGETEAAQRLLQEVEQTFERMDAGWDKLMTREALRRVRMGPDAATTAGHLEAIATFCHQMGTFDDQRSFLEGVLERIVDLLSADRGFIVLFDEAGRPSLKVVHRRDDGPTAPGDQLFSRTITRDAFQADEPIYIPVTIADERYKAAQSVALMDVRSVVAACVRSYRRRRGVVYLDSRTPENEELRRAVPLVAALSSVIGASLEHAELLELERSRSETMAMLAHELRGPLNGIYAHVELMREQAETLTTDLREYLDVASSELLRLNRMISNLTDLARLEHHSSANTVVSIDIRELLSTVAANLSGLSRAKRQRVEVEIPPAIPFVLGSRDRIIQVVTNLLTNAIKFTPEGGAIRLTARLVEPAAESLFGELGPEVPPSEFLTPVQAHVSDSGQIEVSILDSGPGIPEDQFEAIFGKFRQSGERRVRKHGLGLGLAIARHIVERHGGHIWCENPPEGGAAFRFTVPALHE